MWCLATCWWQDSSCSSQGAPHGFIKETSAVSSSGFFRLGHFFFIFIFIFLISISLLHYNLGQLFFQGLDATWNSIKTSYTWSPRQRKLGPSTRGMVQGQGSRKERWWKTRYGGNFFQWLTHFLFGCSQIEKRFVHIEQFSLVIPHLLYTMYINCLTVWKIKLSEVLVLFVNLSVCLVVASIFYSSYLRRTLSVASSISFVKNLLSCKTTELWRSSSSTILSRVFLTIFAVLSQSVCFSF